MASPIQFTSIDFSDLTINEINSGNPSLLTINLLHCSKSKDLPNLEQIAKYHDITNNSLAETHLKRANTLFAIDICALGIFALLATTFSFVLPISFAVSAISIFASSQLLILPIAVYNALKSAYHKNKAENYKQISLAAVSGQNSQWAYLGLLGTLTFSSLLIGGAITNSPSLSMIGFIATEALGCYVFRNGLYHLGALRERVSLGQNILQELKKTWFY